MKLITRETFGPVTDRRMFVEAIEADHALPKAEADILADLCQLKAAGPLNPQPDTFTVFKNGGGAPLDLMIANAILRLEASYQ